jgi:erythromycin esterase-like protein
VIEFTIPFPSAKLNPNQSKGMHWAATSKLRKDARQFAFMQARQVCCGKALFGDSGDVAISVTFVMPDRRARDRDNLLAALKPSLDGVAEAIGVNDSRFEPITIRREFGTRPGLVRILIGAP